MRALIKRELGIVLGAPATWGILALAALLVGHGFVLALDLFAAASRSALGQQLMKRELDPLLGIVRPTLGGAQLAVALLLPILAARPLALEKERNSFAALALRVGSTDRVVAAKLFAAWVSGALLLAIPLLLLLALVLAGGHLGLSETLVALIGYSLFVALIASASVAGAAATRSFAQAATVGMTLSLSSWAIDASEGFSALAWLGPFASVSVGSQLTRFEHGILTQGGLAWLTWTVTSSVAVAVLLGRIERSWKTRGLALVLIVVALPVAAALGRSQRGIDCTEQKRMSLPVPAEAALRAHTGPLSVDVWLERDDARRSQLERDLLAKLRLARPDIEIRMPLDIASTTRGMLHEASYGWIVVRAGASTRRTRSTSRKEVTTLIFEAIGAPLPDWSQNDYPGYPWVPTSDARAAMVALAYGVLPGICGVLGIMAARKRRTV